jgi:hypothetical protein
MTYENAKDFLPIVQAMAEGKKVRFKNHIGRWVHLQHGENISMERDPADYEIVREPRVVWLNEYPDGSYGNNCRIACDTQEQADRFKVEGRIACRKFIEVIEE